MVDVIGSGGPFAFAWYEPSLKITPDLGWSDREDMFDDTKNPFMIAYTLDTLTTVGWTSGRNKTRDTLVFTYGGTNYLLPDGAIDRLGAQGRHLWRVEDEAIAYFNLRLNSPAGVTAPDPKASSLTILE